MYWYHIGACEVTRIIIVPAIIYGVVDLLASAPLYWRFLIWGLFLCQWQKRDFIHIICIELFWL